MDEEAKQTGTEAPGFNKDAVAAAKKDCDAFIKENETTLEDIEASQAGHDFWLTRNGHGVGFLDRNLGAVGKRLYEASKAFGEAFIEVGDDGWIHYRGGKKNPRRKSRRK